MIPLLVSVHASAHRFIQAGALLDTKLTTL